MPGDLLLVGETLRLCFSVDDEPKLTVDEVPILPASLRRHPSAVRAWWRCRHQDLALWALAQPRCFAALTLVLRRVLGSLIDVERPLDMILGQAMAIDRAAVVEDDDVVLARRGTKATADHLPEQAHLFGRTREDDAADLGTIEPLRQHHAVGHTSISPEASRARIVSRSPFGVEP